LTQTNSNRLSQGDQSTAVWSDVISAWHGYRTRSRAGQALGKPTERSWTRPATQVSALSSPSDQADRPESVGGLSNPKLVTHLPTRSSRMAGDFFFQTLDQPHRSGGIVPAGKMHTVPTMILHRRHSWAAAVTSRNGGVSQAHQLLDRANLPLARGRAQQQKDYQRARQVRVSRPQHTAPGAKTSTPSVPAAT